MGGNRWIVVWLAAFLVTCGAVDFASAQGAGDQADSRTGSADSGVGENSPSTSAAEKAASEGSSTEAKNQMILRPMLCLVVGIITVVGLIIAFRLNAFISLITAAIVVSMMAPGDIEAKISRVASAFGSAAGSIGIVIAMAAVIGKCMLDSGAADRIVQAFLRLMGEKRSPMALMGSGFVLAVPVFFDTVFYLLVPLARSLHTRTGKQYLKYIMAIGAGGAITHTLVPPTPGPLLMASNLGFDVGVMILVGGLVALPAACVGLTFAGWLDGRMPIPMRPLGAEGEATEPLDEQQLPSLLVSLLPVVLPVLLISTNTVLTTVADNEHAALLTAEDITDLRQFRATVGEQAAQGEPTPGGRLVAVLEPGAKSKNAEKRRQLVDLLLADRPLSEKEQQELVAGLNQYVLPNKDFYTEEAFLGVRINDVAQSLLGKDRVRMKKAVAERMNRALLESAFNRTKPELIAEHAWDTPKRKAANLSAFFGDPNLALLLSAVIAIATLVKQRGLSRTEMAAAVEASLMSGGVIILITAAGGAFGQMLKEAGVGEAMKSLFQIEEGAASAGMLFLILGFLIATVLKVAQGSSTVAMITGSGMLAGIAQPELLGYHPVYLATAIGAGSLIGSWMNDSGFWIFAKMGGLTETEALKSWTIMLIVLGLTSFVTTLVLAVVLPLA